MIIKIAKSLNAQEKRFGGRENSQFWATFNADIKQDKNKILTEIENVEIADDHANIPIKRLMVKKANGVSE